MDSSFYLPILKSKEAEFTALSNLDSFSRKHIRPLFEIGPIDYDHNTGKKPKTLEEHLHNFCHRKFIKKWLSERCFIDAHQLEGQQVYGMSCIEYIYQQLNCLLIPIHPVPVARPKARPAELAHLRAVMNNFKIEELGLRVNIEDITAAGFASNINHILQQFSVSPAQVHLILDLAIADFVQINDFSDAIVAILDGFPFLDEWGSFSICGGAFPQTGHLKKGVNYVARNDWKFFLEVKRKLAMEAYNRPLNYGDYGVVYPGYVEYDHKKMKPSANIRYTLDDTWFVVKGSSLKGPTGYSQYVDQAKTIVTEEFFYGEAFSKGDMYIKNCSLRYVESGSPMVWLWVGNNHHFTKVVSDLFSSQLGS